MKNVLKSLGFLTVLGALVFISSCGSDDGGGIIIDDDGGLLVADGFYPAKDGEDPIAVQQMTSVSVDGPDITAMEREGFYQVYAYLTAGSYNIVEVKDGEIVSTYGGASSTVEGESTDQGDAVDRNIECDESNSSFTLVDAEVNGATFSIPADGLYVIAYDEQTSEIVFDQLTSVGVIGPATPGGWGADTELTGSVSSTGGVWTVDGLALEEGEWKFRFNCRWAIDRRIDATMAFDNTNGYSLFTNFGGTLAALEPGNEGSNIQNTVRGEYTITMTWNPVSGFSAEATKTGDLAPLPEYLEEVWMVGASIGGWSWTDNGVQMIPVHSNPHLFWRIVWIDANATDPGIKFAPQPDWIGDFGVAETALENDGIYSKGTNNVPSPTTSGYYTVVVNLEEGAETIEVNPATVYGIGDAFGTWDAGVEANLFTEDTPNQLLVSPTFSADGDLRMYVTSSTFTPVGTDPAIEWWQAEFVVLDGSIAYRGTGGDQARAAVSSGQSVSLDFINGTGTIN